jgi:lipid A 4'-phosphatase
LRYLLASLILGPGLIVNVLLKDHWGRARPLYISQGGGTAHFTPPLIVTDQCQSNCAFSSGHAALGYWLVSVALLAPPAWRGRAVAGALAFGTLIGFTRIAQGAHFLSDVVASGIIVVAVALVLRRRMLADWL